VPQSSPWSHGEESSLNVKGRTARKIGASHDVIDDGVVFEDEGFLNDAKGSEELMFDMETIASDEERLKRSSTEDSLVALSSSDSEQDSGLSSSSPTGTPKTRLSVQSPRWSIRNASGSNSKRRVPDTIFVPLVEPEEGKPCSRWIAPTSLLVGNRDNRRAMRKFLENTASFEVLKGHFRARQTTDSRSESWKKRFFMCLDNFLFEFESRKDTSPIGFLPLCDLEVSMTTSGSLLVSFEKMPNQEEMIADEKTVSTFISRTPDAMMRSSTRLFHGVSQAAGSPGADESKVDRAIVNKMRQRGGTRTHAHPSTVVVEMQPLQSQPAKSSIEARKWVKRISVNSSHSFEDLYFLHDGKDSVLGEGRYAKVHEVTRKLDGFRKAVKIVNKTEYWELVALGKERADALNREINTQVNLTLNSSESVRINKVFELRDYLILEMDLMDRLNLFQVLQASPKKCFSEVRAADVAIGLLGCLQLLEQSRISHRDIKLSNIVLSQGAGKGFEELSSKGLREALHIIDFGMAAYVADDNMLTGRCGTPGYVAPDILRAGHGEYYHSNVDIFSVGVVIYTLLCGFEPFQRQDLQQTLKANKECSFEFHAPYWNSISSDAKDFISKVLIAEPEHRLSPSAALAHPWLARNSVNERQEIRRSRNGPAVVISKSDSSCVIS